MQTSVKDSKIWKVQYKKIVLKLAKETSPQLVNWRKWDNDMLQCVKLEDLDQFGREERATCDTW